VAPATGGHPVPADPGAVPARYSPHEYIGPFRPPRAARRGRSLHLILVPRVFRVNLELKDAPHVACTRTTSNGAGSAPLAALTRPARILAPRVHRTDSTAEGAQTGRFMPLLLVPRVSRAIRALEGARHVACTRPTSSPPGPAAARSPPAARATGPGGSPQSTATMTNSASPRGVRTWTVSPAFFPTSALPTGDMFEIRPAEGSASGGPTSS
jgi:hypothetical protein